MPFLLFQISKFKKDRKAFRFPHESKAVCFLISTEKIKEPKWALIFLPVDISENEWNQLIDYIIQWHLTIEEELKRIRKFKNR